MLPQITVPTNPVHYATTFTFFFFAVVQRMRIDEADAAVDVMPYRLHVGILNTWEDASERWFDANKGTFYSDVVEINMWPRGNFTPTAPFRTSAKGVLLMFGFLWSITERCQYDS